MLCVACSAAMNVLIFTLTELMLFTCPISNLFHEHVTALFWDVTSCASAYVDQVHVGMLMPACIFRSSTVTPPLYASSALPMDAPKMPP
jgi:hypothetical protein